METVTADAVQQMAGFARNEILACADLGQSSQFPENLWKDMGQLGLLDPDRFTAKTGESVSCRCLTAGARAMAENGGNLGLTLSWIIHHLTAGVMLKPEVDEAVGQLGELWEAVKKGNATLSFAVSEPKGGGHPKLLRTRAEKQGNSYLISGEKTYLTNGPIAHAFIVVAITGEDGGKKAFSAFLVNRDTSGLEVGPPMEVPFFKPSPHGSIRMENCRVPVETLMGREGLAYPEFVLTFRQMEDALMTGAVTGAMAFLLADAATALARAVRDGRSPDDDALGALGSLASQAQAAGVLSDAVAGFADTGEKGREGVHLYFRDLAQQFVREMKDLLERSKVCLDLPGKVLLQDLEASAGLGKTIAGLRRKKLGRAMAGSVQGSGT